jgi:FtsP/CotA-like multicopper oxidase with cupredoxin domain
VTGSDAGAFDGEEDVDGESPGGEGLSSAWGAAVFAIAIAGMAAVVAIIAMGLGVRAVDEAEAAGGAAPATVTATLAEFSISPDPLVVEAGGRLQVDNAGAAVHNLAVKGRELRTSNLDPDGSATLDVSSLPAGDYTVICEIPGHESAGMSATLTIGSGTAGEGDHAGHGGTLTADEMDELMAARTAAFPAATKGRGAVELAPTIAADGAAEYRLTADEIDWEVEPGKTVKAMAYNGMVPGPTLRVAVGQPVRIVLTNNMDESTVLHLHGIPNLRNAMDGVPDITQPPIKPGASFTYEFTALSPMVGMYHSHHNAQVQVPNGLLGAIYVGELDLPPGVPTPAVSQPMILNDAGTIGFSLNGKSFPATEPVVASRGDWVRIDYMNEGMQVHPMHLHGMPQLVFAKDGFTLATPRLEDTVLVAPGERISVLVHATEVGTWAYHCHILNHAEREDGMFGMVTVLVVQ